MFQYEFKVPGDDKAYSVLWDYQVGLVRITPFFKCCKYSKVSWLACSDNKISDSPRQRPPKFST